MDTLMLIIGIAIVAVGVLMILREFWCWYWKINKISSQIEEQNRLLRELVNRNEKPNTDVSPLS